MTADEPGDRLVTIATYWSPVEANLARNALDAAGVRAILVGEETVGMAWHLTNAIGGVKVQVRSADADRATELLDAISPADDATAADDPDDYGQDSGEADDGFEAEHDREGDEKNEAGKTKVDAPDRALTRRELDADKALRVAMLGLLMIPLQLYVFWLLARVYVSEEPLAADKRWSALVAGAINFPFVLLVFVYVSIMINE